MGKTKRERVVECVITHLEDTILVKDIAEQVPDIEYATVQNMMSFLAKAGYVSKCGHMAAAYLNGKQIGSGAAIFKILSREPYAPGKKGGSYVKKKAMKPGVKPTLADLLEHDISAEQLGDLFIRYISELKEKVCRLSDGYSSAQSELNKELSANRIAIDEKDKLIKELKEECLRLKERIRLEANGSSKSRFPLSEIISIREQSSFNKRR